jgi:hypothetical protein
MLVRQPSTVLLLFLVLAGCSDSSPARIALGQSDIRLVDRKPVPIQATLVTESGKILAEPALSYSATPANVVTLDQTGTVRCQSSGDAIIVVAGGGQSASVSVACRLVSRLEVAATVRLTVGDSPMSLDVRPYDERGQLVTGVQPQFTSDRPSIATVDANGVLVASAPGSSNITIVAGEARSVTTVSVRQLVKSESVALADGASTTWTLQKGSYELDLTVAPSDGHTTGVTVKWVGVDCPGSAEAQQHSIECAVPGTASVTVSNPSLLGLGPSITGFLNLYRTRL